MEQKMTGIKITGSEARKFILSMQGLWGAHRFEGKRGALDFVRHASCVQFDPIDVCGKSPEIVLNSRVRNFRKSMLYELLYSDRLLVDYFDKNLSIIPVENYPIFARTRQMHRDFERSRGEIERIEPLVIQTIKNQGPMCSADFNLPQKVDWYWSRTKLSRATLEHLYFAGRLAVHHKRGNIKYYDLAERCIPKNILDAPDPCPDDFEHKKRRVLQRIGAVGLLWNRASDAWLGIPALKSKERNGIFDALLAEERIIPVDVDGMSRTLYCRAEDLHHLDKIRQENPQETRCELIAPLDSMMWDRIMIKELFDFDYKWEIYTPASGRKFGWYVLPVLFGERLVGRIEAVFDRKLQRLNVLNLWYEDAVRVTDQLQDALGMTIRRFEDFNRGQ